MPGRPGTYWRSAGTLEEQLRQPGEASFGGIPATFNHVVESDAGWLRRLTGSGPAWLDRGDSADLDELGSRVDQTPSRWEECLAGPVDAERVYVVDDRAREVRAGVIVAQALHHGNAHREQICAILTGFGTALPDVQPWEYAWATGRIWDRAPER